MSVLLAMIRPAVYGIFDHVSIVLNQRLCMQPSYSNMFNQRPRSQCDVSLSLPHAFKKKKKKKPNSLCRANICLELSIRSCPIRLSR